MKPITRSFYEMAVQKAVELVVANLDQALDLGALAREAALSPFHFHRVFRGLTGETPLELHRRLRMERAAWQWRKPPTPAFPTFHSLTECPA
jgi:AraC family transcriptional regulator